MRGEIGDEISRKLRRALGAEDSAFFDKTEGILDAVVGTTLS
jgi:hypothetical protein